MSVNFKSFNSDDIKLSQFATNLLTRKAERFSKRISRFFDENLPLNIAVSRNDQGVKVEITLQVGQKTLHAMKVAVSDVEAVRDSMNSLLRQFDKIRMHKIPALRKKVRERKTSKKPRAKEIFASGVTKLPNQIIEELYPFLRRVATEKVALFQATAGIEPGYLDPDEIVDEVLVERIGSLDPERGLIEVKKQLFQAITATVKKHVHDYEVDSQNLVSTDMDIPEIDEKIELSTLGDEVLDFCVLDEDLVLEDVIETPGGKSPEDIVADKEARHVLMNALLRLPPRSRYIFTSYVMDENSIEDVAAFVDEDLQHTEQILRDATLSLRCFLTESDRLLTEDNVVALYRHMSEMFHADPFGISRASTATVKQGIGASVTH